jgi:hypothetical protein
VPDDDQVGLYDGGKGLDGLPLLYGTWAYGGEKLQPNRNCVPMDIYMDSTWMA